MFSMKSEHSFGDIFEGMVIGGSLVAMTTFFLSTKKGKQFQKNLMDKYHEVKDKAEEMEKKLHKVASPAKVKAQIKGTVKKSVSKAASKDSKRARAR